MVHYLYKGEQNYDAVESNGHCTICLLINVQNSKQLSFKHDTELSLTLYEDSRPCHLAHSSYCKKPNKWNHSKQSVNSVKTLFIVKGKLTCSGYAICKRQKVIFVLVSKVLLNSWTTLPILQISDDFPFKIVAVGVSCFRIKFLIVFHRPDLSSAELSVSSSTSAKISFSLSSSSADASFSCPLSAEASLISRSPDKSSSFSVDLAFTPSSLGLNNAVFVGLL